MKSKLLLSILLTSVLGLLSLSAHAETEGKIKGRVKSPGDKGTVMSEAGSGAITPKFGQQGLTPTKPTAAK